MQLVTLQDHQGDSLMKNIEKVILVISETRYFSAWEETLLSDDTLLEWKKLLKPDTDEASYYALGKRLYAQKIPFVIVTEYLDEFFRYLDHPSLNTHRIKNCISKAFLNEKLESDRLNLEKEITKKSVDLLDDKRELINAHLKWMQAFIDTVIGKPAELELNPEKCYVGKWLIEDEPEKYHPVHISKLHQDIHAMTQSALRMHSRGDYAYFLLLYGDILMSSYKIRDIIMNIFFTKRLTSIYKDPLTSISNYFQIKIDIEANSGDNDLFVFNIREFSKINMLYGLEGGDKIIKEIIDRLLNIEGTKQVYRIYGDEFALIFPSKLRREILDRFEKEVEQHDYHIGKNEIILSFYGSISRIVPHVLERGEYGLMLSKTHHGNFINMDEVNEETLQKYAEKITLSQQLRLAFMDNRILPYFQGILDLKSNKITKYEVLMRIRDLNGKILKPAVFLKHLQGMYIYPEVSNLMIQKAFEAFKNNHFDFSINLSFADIINPKTKGFILAILKQYPDTARRCTFELLESEAILNPKEVASFLDTLHSYKVKIALDDFGAGYINYDTIFKFEIDYIKIDGLITQSLLSDHKSFVLMQSIITVANELGAKIIGEFIDSRELLDRVRDMGMHYAQGYYISEPSEKLL